MGVPELQDLILYQINLQFQGLPIDEEVDDKIVEISTLLLAQEFVGNTDYDNLIIENKILSILSLTQKQKPFILNLFNWFKGSLKEILFT